MKNEAFNVTSNEPIELNSNQQKLFTMVKMVRWLHKEGYHMTAESAQKDVEAFCDELDWDLLEMMPVTLALRAEGIIS